MTSPLWVRDELIMAFDMLQKSEVMTRRERADAVQELSSALRALWPRQSKFSKSHRSVQSVGAIVRQLAEIRDQGVLPGPSSQLKEKVVRRFKSDPNRLSSVSGAIRTVAKFHFTLEGLREQLGVVDEHPDGLLLYALHRKLETETSTVSMAFREAGGDPECIACGMNFHSTYGDQGLAAAQAHSMLDLSKIVSDDSARTAVGSVVLLCANCHAITHKTGRMPVVE